MHGLILRAQSGMFWVLTDSGLLECTLRGRLRREQVSTDLAVIGDYVEVEAVELGRGVITALAERRTRLSRRRPDGTGEDVLAANLDQLLVVFACDQPRPSPRMIDRFLVAAEHNGLMALIIATKADLLNESERQAIFAPYERVGYTVLFTSTNWPETINPVRTHLVGRMSALCGPSGVGKSSLLNLIDPSLRLRTSAVSQALGKGRHTTVAAELLPLAEGGYVADTPGIRELGLWQIPPEELDICFPELRELRTNCAFVGCSHLHEPGCAVRAAVERGEVSAARYESYARLYQGDPEDAPTRRTAPTRPVAPRRAAPRIPDDWETWDEWEDEVPATERMRSRTGHAPKEAEQRARSREFGRMAKQIKQRNPKR